MFQTIPPLQIGGLPGGFELVVVLLVLVLLFGANKIPKLARSTGQAMGEFQRGRQQIEEELEDMQEGPQTTETEGEPTGAETAAAESTESEEETEEERSA